MASTPTRDLQEEFLAATRKSQETVIRAIKTWVETVRTVSPKLPSVYAPLADRLSSLPSVTVPFADKLPKPEDVVANGYDFAEHLLALQRRFAEDLLTATEPLIPGNSKSSSATQAPTAKAATAPRPVAPKVEFKSAVPQGAVTEPAPEAAVVPSTPKAPAPKPPTAAPKPATRAVKPAAAPAKPATARKAPAAKNTESTPSSPSTPSAPKPTPAARAPRSTAAKAANTTTSPAAKSPAEPAPVQRTPKDTDAG